MKSFTTSLLSAAALYASTVYAQAAVHVPSGANEVQYSVSIPASTQSTGSGDIFMQITAPTTYQWIGLGIGKQMAGAHVFIIYQDGKGNVTLSPRNAVGEIMPLYNPQAQAMLLEGSGVAGTQMIANFKYTVNNTIIDPTSNQSPWICSWRKGSALDSSDPAAVLTQHDDHDQFTYNLQAATIQSDSNPFVPQVGQATPAASSAAPGATGATAGASSSSSSSSSSSEEVFPLVTYQKAHGIIMSVALVLILPFGAIAMRLGINVWVHAAIQILALCMIVAGFGLGIHLAQYLEILYKNPHTICGTVFFVAIILQPFLGLLHHRQYKNLGRRSYFAFMHVWYGRVIIILGIINGGLGLWLANNTKKGEIAYGVVAGVVGVFWFAVVVLTLFRRRGGGKDEGSVESRRLEKRSSPGRAS